MTELHPGGLSDHPALLDDQAQTIRFRLANLSKKQKLTGVEGQQQRRFVHGHEVQ